MTGPRVRMALEHKREDCWIGVFWRWTYRDRLEIWICLVPTVPIHLTVQRKTEHPYTRWLREKEKDGR